MKAAPSASRCWRPDNRFLAVHLYLPLVVAVLVLTLLELSGVDLWLADRWYEFEGGAWSLKNHWLTSDIIHHRGKQLVIALALSLVVLLVASWRSALLRPWQRPLAYLLTCMLLLPGMVAGLKRFSTVPCPWSLARYGGDMAYQHNYQHALAWGAGGNCFPAGHASGAYVLLVLYFAMLGRTRRPWLFLLPGLCLGAIYGLGQQARGAHFLSHDLWTLSICWFGALALFLLIRPDATALRQAW